MSSSPSLDFDYYRPCDTTSNAACDVYHHKRGAMRVTLRKAVQGTVFIACIFLLNFVYFNAYLIQWRTAGLYGDLSWKVQQQHRAQVDATDLRIRRPGFDPANIGTEYDAMIIPAGRDLILRDLRGVVADVRLSGGDKSRPRTDGSFNIWDIVGDSMAGSKPLPNFFWRSNQPVDSGDTRSLLDLQTRKKRRRTNTKVIYEQREEQPVPLLAVVQQAAAPSKRQQGSFQQKNTFILQRKDFDNGNNRNKIQDDDNRKNTYRKSAASSLLLKRLTESSKSRKTLKFKKNSRLLPSFSPPSLYSSTSSPSSINLASSSSFPLQTNGRPTTLNDIFISVKTTKKFHEKRLKLVLDTWFQFAKDQTYFFTDTNDKGLNQKTNNHMINTNCSAVHNRQALCCKMAQEYDSFIESKKRWFCHVDDDTYINIPKLVTLLQKYNHTKDWYLGKPSLKHPIEIMDRDNPGQKISFWFATGGAGFCISRSLALKMLPHAGNGRLMTVGEKIRLPDDCTVGYIIGHILKKQLTIEDSFHSHLEALWLLRPFDLDRQVTFSYSKYGEKMNIVNVPGFTNKEDPTRLWSIHCHLFPYLRECRSLQ